MSSTIYATGLDMPSLNHSAHYKVTVKQYGGSTAGWETVFEIENIRGTYLKQLWYNNSLFAGSAKKVEITELEEDC